MEQDHDLQEKVAVHALAGQNGQRAIAVSVDHTSRCWREFHDRYTICATIEPKAGISHGAMRYRSKDFEIEPGQLLFMEPGELHVTKALDGTASFRLLQIEPEAMADMAGAEPDQAWHWSRVMVQEPALAQRFVQAHDVATRTGDPEVFGPILQDLAALAREGHPNDETARVRSELVKVAQCLRKRYLEHPTLQELASDVGLTRYRLVQLFSRELGLPPMQYLLEWRLGIARRCLVEGHPVTQAAHEAGFYDQAQFCRLFRRAYGITPGKYRSAVSP